ncbi:hypothetical protein U1Q18_051087 [Sarracenia purpurea var. burkii]
MALSMPALTAEEILDEFNFHETFRKLQHGIHGTRFKRKKHIWTVIALVQRGIVWSQIPPLDSRTRREKQKHTDSARLNETWRPFAGVWNSAALSSGLLIVADDFRPYKMVAEGTVRPASGND